MKNVPIIDLSGAYILDDIIEKSQKQGAKILITGIRPEVRKTLENLKILDKVGTQNCVEHIHEAATKIQELDRTRKH